jgi:hypothetical protein
MPNSDYLICVSKYVNFGKCQTPDEIEWRSLTTQMSRPAFLRSLFTKREKDQPRNEATKRPTIDLTHLEPICDRFRAKLHAPLPSSPFIASPIASYTSGRSNGHLNERLPHKSSGKIYDEVGLRVVVEGDHVIQTFVAFCHFHAIATWLIDF